MSIIKHWPSRLGLQPGPSVWSGATFTHRKWKENPMYIYIFGIIIYFWIFCWVRLVGEITRVGCIYLGVNNRVDVALCPVFVPAQETESRPVPWASSSSSSNMKTWTVCTDSVSLPHHHNRDLHTAFNYQIHLNWTHFNSSNSKSRHENTGLIHVHYEYSYSFIGLRGHMNVSLHGCIGVLVDSPPSLIYPPSCC